VHPGGAADLCALSRNGVIGFTRCLSLRPTGAIMPDGDSVVTDRAICVGYGQCAAACLTGAAACALPAAATVVAACAQRLNVLAMCRECRVEKVVNQGFDPHDERTRKVRIAADYKGLDPPGKLN